MPPARRPLAERFRERLVPQGTCIVYTGAKDGKGYGRIATGGRGGRLLGAHRLAWELRHGPIPDGLMVCHTCDNPPCCNPDHLFLGTQADNMADAAAKGRARSPRQKLTFEQRQAVLRRYLAGEPARDLAAEFGISASAVENAAYRHRRRSRK